MVEELVKGLAKSGAIKILRALKDDGKRLTDLVREVDLDKSTVWRRLEEFEKKLFLVYVEYNRELKAPIYKLTPYGQVILEKLEELEALLQDIAKTPEKPLEEIENQIVAKKVRPTSEDEEEVRTV